MDTSLLLARVIGPYMLIAGLALFLNRDFYKKMLDEYPAQPLLMLVIGAFTLILGLLFVQFHNIWAADWRVLVTLIGWITLIKGVAALMFPAALIRLSDAYKQNDSLLTMQAAFAILLGAYMSYMGYFSTGAGA